MNTIEHRQGLCRIQTSVKGGGGGNSPFGSGAKANASSEALQ